MGLGAFYGFMVILISIYFAEKTFNFLNKNKRDRIAKIIALFSSTIIWVLVIAISWNISWRFPIDDSLWSYFSSSHLIVMWFTLIFYFKKNRSAR